MKYLIDQNHNFETASNTDIVNHILKKNHAFLKGELSAIEDLVFIIYKVHFKDSGEVLEKVHKLYGEIKIEFESHMIKEEMYLFHLIKEYENNPREEVYKDIMRKINSIEKNNEEIIKNLKELKIVTNNYTLPKTACPIFQNAYNRIEGIEKDTKEHFNIEENILYNRFKNRAMSK